MSFMQLKKSRDRIWMEDVSGGEVAFVSFPQAGEHTVRIVSTVVDPSLRGQGTAGVLLETLAEELRATKRKAVPVCSYAVKWFKEHPEQQDLLEQVDLKSE